MASRTIAAILGDNETQRCNIAHGWCDDQKFCARTSKHLTHPGCRVWGDTHPLIEHSHSHCGCGGQNIQAVCCIRICCYAVLHHCVLIGTQTYCTYQYRSRAATGK
jgi:hypothetical protein